MNWFKPKQWKKIGEVTRSTPWWIYHNYSRYAVMECIYSDGRRKYKEVLMCRLDSSYDNTVLESQPEDPLKEINDILRTH